ncbi:MAG: hypothetical protein B6229_05465 [Spirochaetaceae bacterium 4572_7]|nr:MAG: hypothetical protein B6229_05465 [Spirochaetaceae bacterium 4572_7]
MSFEVIDIVFVVLILIFGFNGFRLGFFSQLFTVIGLIVGLFSAYFFSDDLSLKLVGIIGNGPWNNLISFILILAAILLLSQLLNKIFKNSLEALGAQGLDKIFGFTYGLVQGLVVCLIITTLLTLQSFTDPTPIFENSLIGSRFVSVVPEFQKLFPDTQKALKKLEKEL